jgi:proline dehydrogenase
MLRSLFLWLSEQRQIFEFLKKNGFARKAASRFVAGETVESALDAARALNANHITVSLDLLGESVGTPEEACAARDEVIHLLGELGRSGVDGNVSVKLTQMGLDLDYSLCLENMRIIMRRAREHDIFVRIDMESSAHTERTLILFGDLHREYGNLTGVVIQSYLMRSSQDVEDLIAMGARVRLCKGAYAEPETVAFQDKREVDTSFVALLERLLDEGNYPGIATHDERLIEHAIGYTRKRGIPADRFEFQMLYGVRRDLHSKLRERGFNMRVYVPFGRNWYPYLMRRLGERPGNMGFMLGSVVRETIARR